MRNLQFLLLITSLTFFLLLCIAAGVRVVFIHVFYKTLFSSTTCPCTQLQYRDTYMIEKHIHHRSWALLTLQVTRSDLIEKGYFSLLLAIVIGLVNWRLPVDIRTIIPTHSHWVLSFSRQAGDCANMVCHPVPLCGTGPWNWCLMFLLVREFLSLTLWSLTACVLGQEWKHNRGLSLVLRLVVFSVWLRWLGERIDSRLC